TIARTTRPLRRYVRWTGAVRWHRCAGPVRRRGRVPAVAWTRLSRPGMAARISRTHWRATRMRWLDRRGHLSPLFRRLPWLSDRRTLTMGTAHRVQAESEQKATGKRSDSAIRCNRCHDLSDLPAGKHGRHAATRCSRAWRPESRPKARRPKAGGRGTRHPAARGRLQARTCKPGGCVALAPADRLLRAVRLPERVEHAAAQSTVSGADVLG